MGMVESNGIEPFAELRPDRSGGTDRPPRHAGRRGPNSRACRSTRKLLIPQDLRVQHFRLCHGGGRANICTAPVSNHTARPSRVAGYYPVKVEAPAGVE